MGRIIDVALVLFDYIGMAIIAMLVAGWSLIALYLFGVGVVWVIRQPWN